MNHFLHPLQTDLNWEDLKLDDATTQSLMRIGALIRKKNTLVQRWLLRPLMKRSITVLFYGTEGIGKTLAAALVGKHAGVRVFRIDMKVVISKYIGETEKNLDKLFSKAENQNWILFFDEADDLFGKRTEVKDSHDRYANKEIEYLMQKIGDYNGITILATHSPERFDEAFRRRFHHVVAFHKQKIAQ